MTGGKVSDEVIDAIAFIEMHRQETEKESGSGLACAEALPKLQALLEELNADTTGPADVRAANIAAVTNDIARVKRFASGGGGHGGNKHPRAGGGGQKKQALRQHGHGQQRASLGQGQGGGQGHGGSQGQGGGQNAGGQGQPRGPNQGQGRRRGRNKRRGGSGGGGNPGNGGGNGNGGGSNGNSGGAGPAAAA